MTPNLQRMGVTLLVLIGPLLIGAAQRPSGLGDVREVRTWSYKNYTRVVVELDRTVPLEKNPVRRLGANAAARRPDRLFVDLAGIWVGTRYDDGIPVSDGLLAAVRLGQNTLQNTRLVIDLENYGHHRIFTLASPPRVVIDVYGDKRAQAAPRRAGDPDPGGGQASGRLAAPLRRVDTIVVDPGHGGRDPGATGVGGLKEKVVNLAIAKQLAKDLRGAGFKVVLTRDADRTVDLEERTAIAESSDGDVFVSIHANASRRKGARGIEIYTLDANHERHSLDVASRENGVPAAKLDALQRALAKLRADEAAHHSERLAGHVHKEILAGVQKHDRALPDLGIKKGPFYVLFMSSMPALLVETGFLTNPRDARLLRSEKFQSTLASNIAAGIKRYRTQVEAGLIAAAATTPLNDSAQNQPPGTTRASGPHTQPLRWKR